MGIVTQLMLIVLMLTVGFVVIVFQIFGLARIYRSWSWWIGAGTFLLLGAKQIFGLIRLPAMILQAQMKGVMIERLSLEQWGNVAVSFVIVGGFILFFDWLRRDLKKIGI